MRPRAAQAASTSTTVLPTSIGTASPASVQSPRFTLMASRILARTFRRSRGAARAPVADRGKSEGTVIAAAMDTSAPTTRFLDADQFLPTEQFEFGTAWRHELVRGAIVAHAPPSPEH